VPRPKATRPTDREIAILRVLWDRGPSTVGDVKEALDEERDTGYTTALKLLQIMTEKGLVTRDESRHAHVYRARHPQKKTEKLMVGDLLERVFGGSAANLVMHALSSKKASPEELAQIRELLDSLEDGS